MGASVALFPYIADAVRAPATGFVVGALAALGPLILAVRLAELQPCLHVPGAVPLLGGDRPACTGPRSQPPGSPRGDQHRRGRHAGAPPAGRGAAGYREPPWSSTMGTRLNGVSVSGTRMRRPPMDPLGAALESRPLHGSRSRNARSGLARAPRNPARPPERGCLRPDPRRCRRRPAASGPATRIPPDATARAHAKAPLSGSWGFAEEVHRFAYLPECSRQRAHRADRRRDQ